jgi:hypothetical protein
MKQIPGTSKTPEITIKAEISEIQIKGVIIPENPQIFFTEFEDLLSNCKKSFDKLVLDFDLEYFNTGAARYLYKIFKDFKSDQIPVTVVWRYESDDEDILESGEEFQELSGLEFNFVVK